MTIDNRTAAILQRVPRILAVTAASYGLAQQAQARAGVDGKKDHPTAGNAKQGKPH